jgi:guanosine-3',5'-bis(diphosphate) 3'-pyrophosphohydrolase
MIHDPDTLFSNLVSIAKVNNPNFDVVELEKAYRFAAKSHGEQMRQSGDAYITHPVEVATIVAGLRVDQSSVVAALLHDVVEDTPVTLIEIEKEFGKVVSELVDGLTKIAKIEFRSNQERLAENFRKMVMAMAKDLRVIVIKLCDRLHNMRTIKALPIAKRVRIAQETMDIYAPLANRLGIYGIKSELEDLCLRQLKPEIYDDLKQKISIKKAERLKSIEEVRTVLVQELKNYGFVNVEVTGRPKHFFSIFKKMNDRGLQFEDIHDLFAFRIIVDSVKDCYEALGVVHAMWKPMPGRFKDYIAMPKANMYQSLHTTVVRSNGEPCEIQIRTLSMHEVCEYGVAAHWRYKENNTQNTTLSANNPDIEKMAWLRQIVEWQKELKDPDEFLEAVRVDLYDEEIFVFTPKGDVFQLPVKATALDFAFAVHSAVGQSTVGAKVNGRMVPIKKELKSGDIVEILTSAKQQPTKDWLNFVATSKAKNRIRAHLRIEQRDRGKSLGLDILNQELHSRDLEYDSFEKQGYIQQLIKASKEANLDDMLVSIGYGKVSLKDILDRLLPAKVRKSSDELSLEKINQSSSSVSTSKKTSKGQGILVSGLDNFLVSLAKCCSPLPGENIVGFVTRGKGVTIHRGSCSRACDIDPVRKIDVSWANLGEESFDDFTSYISVTAQDRKGILAEVTHVFTTFGSNIKSAQVKSGKDRLGYLDFEITIKSVSQLNAIIGKIEALTSVVKVERKAMSFEGQRTTRRKGK